MFMTCGITVILLTLNIGPTKLTKKQNIYDDFTQTLLSMIVDEYDNEEESSYVSKRTKQNSKVSKNQKVIAKWSSVSSQGSNR